VRPSIRFVQIRSPAMFTPATLVGSDLNMQPHTRRRYMDPTTVTTNRSKAGSSLCRGSFMRAGPKLPDAGSNCAVRRRRDTVHYSPTVPTVEFRIHPLSLARCCLRACQHCTGHRRAPSLYLSLPFTTFRVCLIEDAELDERHRDRHDGDLDLRQRRATIAVSCGHERMR
jgi:hypothetical protein